MYLSYWGRFEVPLDSYETLQLNEQVTRNMCVWVCLDQFASRVHRENGIVCEPSRGWKQKEKSVLGVHLVSTGTERREKEKKYNGHLDQVQRLKNGLR